MLFKKEKKTLVNSFDLLHQVVIKNDETFTQMKELSDILVEGKPVKESTHCGLSKEEMEVPVIVLK